MYEKNINVNSYNYTTNRAKIFDNVKVYKNVILKKYKIIVRLLLASAFNIKNVRRIKLDSNNILLFDFLEYVKTNR